MLQVLIVQLQVQVRVPKCQVRVRVQILTFQLEVQVQVLRICTLVVLEYKCKYQVLHRIEEVKANRPTTCLEKILE